MPSGRWLPVALFVVGAVVLAMVLASWGTKSSPPANDLANDQEVAVYRSPTCSCCAAYEAYLRDEGFAVRTELAEDMAAVKQRFGVPPEAVSCHTALVADYVVEGHVPVAAIERLLRERPTVDGIALPGMPSGSPGMGGDREGPFEILSFKDGVTEPYITL